MSLFSPSAGPLRRRPGGSRPTSREPSPIPDEESPRRPSKMIQNDDDEVVEESIMWGVKQLLFLFFLALPFLLFAGYLRAWYEVDFAQKAVLEAKIESLTEMADQLAAGRAKESILSSGAKLAPPAQSKAADATPKVNNEVVVDVKASDQAPVVEPVSEEKTTVGAPSDVSPADSGTSTAAQQAEPLPVPKVKALEDNGKPYLVFHVGPPETATTTLQIDLTAFAGHLAEDNYHYVGRTFHPFTSPTGAYILNRSTTPLEEAAYNMLHPKHCPALEVSCVEDFKKELDPYLKEGKHVLFSEDLFVEVWKRPGSYEALATALTPDWNVVISAGYKHFFDWMPSTLVQRQRLDAKVAAREEWPHLEGNGKKVELTFPDEVYTWPEACTTFTDAIVLNVNGDIPILIMDMHDTEAGSERSNFLCNALPAAPKSCASSRELDAKGETTVAERVDPSTHPYYDMITTAAAEQGLIDSSKYTRREVGEALRDFTEVTLKREPSSFDWICPTIAARDLLYTKSLEREKIVFGASFTSEMEARHLATFQERIDSKALCWVSTEKVLSRDVWKNFFKSYQ